MSVEPVLPSSPRQPTQWQRTRRLTLYLLLTWFLVTFGTIFFARELSGLILFGWPLSFYMAAQGCTLIYLAIVAVYVIRMRYIERTGDEGTRDAG